MPQYLVIVESPSKAKTIKKYLGSSYKVVASMGHLRDLPKSQLGVDIKNDFSPKYITIRGKGELLSKLKKQAKSSDKIFLATDPDREGEAISWHLANMLDERRDKTLRVSFNEITKNAVKAAIKSPSEINLDLVEAQQARRILDRIVGYSISPILWKKIHKGLSAGRVQSVAARIIVDREREINDFIPKEYWTLDLLLSGASGQQFTASLNTSRDGSKVELACRSDVDKVISGISSCDPVVIDVKTGTKLRNPSPPFTTSTMQQEASKKLNFTSKRTMMAAQRLYEGVDVPGLGTLGLITYMRTDSIRISDEALSAVSSYIKQNFGEKFGLESPRAFKTKKGAQDAHEAIRPTNVSITPEQIKECGDSSLYKLYKLIWERFVASQMASAVYDTVSASISAGDYIFKASGSSLKFVGFRKVYVDSSDADKKEDNKKIPLLAVNEVLKLEKICEEQHYTSPPPRFTEASLIKTMEEEGIGRPSTYASTISTILARRYIVREGKSLIPTELGEVVTDIMKQYFSDIVDIDFTANMEQQLDEIEVGKMDRVHILRQFYAGFETDIKKAEEEIGDLTVEDEVSDVICEKCGRNMVYKNGRYGRFLACPGFPECRNSKPIIVETGAQCPKCGARIIVRKSKRSKEYYGCENNPSCDFMLWNMPNGEKCPECSSLMVRKSPRSDVFICSNKECISNKK